LVCQLTSLIGMSTPILRLRLERSETA